MVYLGLEPGTARWKVQMNPLSSGGTQDINVILGIGIDESMKLALTIMNSCF